MSFSAHADAKGIMHLIRTCEPRSVVLVHGENLKMDFLKDQITKEFSNNIQSFISLFLNLNNFIRERFQLIKSQLNNFSDYLDFSMFGN